MNSKYSSQHLTASTAICCLALLSHGALLFAASPSGSRSIIAERPEEQTDEEVGQIKLKRPGERDFIVDLADLISSSDEQRIREIATKLLGDKATPIIVVTIESMAKYSGAGMRIETFAHLLFDQWSIGQAKLGGQFWNTGILLLVSAKIARPASKSVQAGNMNKTGWPSRSWMNRSCLASVRVIFRAASWPASRHRQDGPWP